MARAILAVAVLATVSCATNLAAAQQPPGASAQIRDANGRLVATAELREDRGELRLSLSFFGPGTGPPLTGGHALHIHEVGRCDPPDFATAGGIFNPTGLPHGRRMPNGSEAGDLPNLVLSPGGIGKHDTYLAAVVSLGTGSASLLGQRGTALVINAAEDDGKTSPDGNAGARIACGVISAGGTGDAGVGSLTAMLIGGVGVALIAAGVALRWRPLWGGKTSR